jgi:hypothetical protein
MADYRRSRKLPTTRPKPARIERRINCRVAGRVPGSASALVEQSSAEGEVANSQFFNAPARTRTRLPPIGAIFRTVSARGFGPFQKSPLKKAIACREASFELAAEMFVA